MAVRPFIVPTNSDIETLAEPSRVNARDRIERLTRRFHRPVARNIDGYSDPPQLQCSPPKHDIDTLAPTLRDTGNAKLYVIVCEPTHGLLLVKLWGQHDLE